MKFPIAVGTYSLHPLMYQSWCSNWDCQKKPSSEAIDHKLLYTSGESATTELPAAESKHCESEELMKSINRVGDSNHSRAEKSLCNFKPTTVPPTHYQPTQILPCRLPLIKLKSHFHFHFIRTNKKPFRKFRRSLLLADGNHPASG